MKTLEKMLIEKNELDLIYCGDKGLHLWRAVHNSNQDKNPLYPDFYTRVVRNIPRRPDVTIKVIGGVEYVEAELVKGTSLFDKPGTFGFKYFNYFEIPARTEIPPGLIIIKGEYNQKYEATHYSICPNHRMKKVEFMKLLDVLASNALAQKRKSNG